MYPRPKTTFLAFTVALVITIAFAGGYLAARIITLNDPPGFQITTESPEEIPLIRFTKWNGRTLSGSFAGRAPRFILGAKEFVVVPAADQSFELDLKKVR